MSDTEGKVNTESTPVASPGSVPVPEEKCDTSSVSKTEDETPEKKEDVLEEEPNELEKKIIHQIEYYFGDHNLVRDKFLKEKIKEDDGWILLSVLLTFKRLQALSEDPEVIVGALRKSTTNLIQIHEDKTKIRRNPDKVLPADRGTFVEEGCQKTVYVKGFPVDSTMDIVMNFFENEGKVINIFMRKKYHSKTFKGSLFVTFETKEEAEAFVKKENLKYKNTVLIKEMRKDYQIRKQNEYEKRKEERGKRQQEREAKPAEEEGKEEETPVDFDPEKHMTKGCLVKLSGFAVGTTREDIKETFQSHGKIAYVDFKIGDPVAVIRFEEAGSAADILRKAQIENDGDLKLYVNDAEITTSIPEGDEEVRYWMKLRQARSNYIKEKKNHKRGHGGSFGRGGKQFRGDFRGRGRGGRGRFDRRRDRRQNEKNGETSVSARKRPASGSGEGPPTKQEKADT